MRVKAAGDGSDRAGQAESKKPRAQDVDPARSRELLVFTRRKHGAAKARTDDEPSEAYGGRRRRGGQVVPLDAASDRHAKEARRRNVRQAERASRDILPVERQQLQQQRRRERNDDEGVPRHPPARKS